MPVPISKLTVSTIRRNAPKRGPTSSDAYNDTVAETVQDLARLTNLWNNSLYPLLSSLPDGTNDLDAYTDGLDGRTLYTNREATPGLADSTYWNSVELRPRSVHEQFEHVYARFVTQKNELLTEIANASGALTDAQKERIGINIFTGGASSSTSLDGKSENNRLNTIQIAKDLYGPGFALDNDGNANLTNNSVFAMVDALLALHGGNWDDDITLNHSSIGDFKSDGSVAMTGPVRLASGAAGTPSLTFDVDTGEDTGFFRVGEDEIGVTIGGVHKLTFGGTNEITAVDGVLNLSGAFVASSLISTATVLRQTSGYFGNTLNGIGAIAHIFDTLDNYTTATALAKFRNNGSDRVTIGIDGRVTSVASIETQADFVLADGSQLITPSADTSVGLDDVDGIVFTVNGNNVGQIDATTEDLVLVNDVSANSFSSSVSSGSGNFVASQGLQLRSTSLTRGGTAVAYIDQDVGQQIGWTFGVQDNWTGTDPVFTVADNCGTGSDGDMAGANHLFKVDGDGNGTFEAGVTGSQLTSTVTTGTAPLVVASTTLVTNLNADTVDGIQGASLVQTSRQVISGNGLTGGGDLSTDRTLTVGAGVGILSNTDDVAVDQAFTPTWTGAHVFQDTVTSAARVHAVAIKTTAGAYNVGTQDDVVIVNKGTGEATTVNLPGSPATGRIVRVKDGKGDANTNNITVTPAAGNIDGAGTSVINTAYGSRTFVYNGTEWNVI